jgi:hypothetical protein
MLFCRGEPCVRPLFSALALLKYAPKSVISVTLHSGTSLENKIKEESTAL